METKKNQARSQKGQNVLNLTEDQAREHIEKLLWPDGQPICRKCGSVNCYRMVGKTCRPGLCRCRDCKKQFTVTVGTIFEDSHLPLATWVRAIHLMATSKKGMSALQLMRNLGLGSYHTAWFLSHRIRLAMKREPMVGLLKGQVQVDETMIGGKPRRPNSDPNWRAKKTPVMVLLESGGRAHAQPISDLAASTLREVMKDNIDESAQVVTDDYRAYPIAAGMFADHQTVNHSAKEYARTQYSNATGKFETITTNEAEGFFALLKRGIHGTFHHISRKHMHRYCDEFSFRWNGRKMTDTERRDATVKGVEGKRLMYKTPLS